MYAERISSSMDTRRTPGSSISTPVVLTSLSLLSRVSFPACAGRRDVGRQTVSRLQLGLLRRRGPQESSLAGGDQSVISATDLALDAVDAPPALGDPAPGAKDLAGVGRRTVADRDLRGDRPGVVAGGRPRHHLVEQG